MIGAVSLDVTFFFKARLTVPSGAMKGGRGFSLYFSKVGAGLMFLGVPWNSGRGNLISRGTSFAPPSAARAEPCRTSPDPPRSPRPGSPY